MRVAMGEQGRLKVSHPCIEIVLTLLKRGNGVSEDINLVLQSRIGAFEVVDMVLASHYRELAPGHSPASSIIRLRGSEGQRLLTAEIALLDPILLPLLLELTAVGRIRLVARDELVFLVAARRGVNGCPREGLIGALGRGDRVGSGRGRERSAGGSLAGRRLVGCRPVHVGGIGVAIDGNVVVGVERMLLIPVVIFRLDGEDMGESLLCAFLGKRRCNPSLPDDDQRNTNA